MKINVLARFISILCVFVSMQVLALSEMNPYRGLVLVEKNYSETKLRELALEQVLIRVSGNRDVATMDEAKLLGNAIPSMLAQFGYKEQNNAQYYYALFDKRKIDAALIAMQQPVWGDTRPNTLIWLVDNSNRQILSDQMVKSSRDAALSWGVKKAELKRGIAVQFPLGDLDDSIAISAFDVTGRFYDVAKVASQRYISDYFVLASLSNMSNGKWKLDWQLVHANNDSAELVVMQDINTGSKSYVLSAMVEGIADYYAQRFAILENNGEKLTQTISVDGITSLAQLAKLNDMLTRLNAVDSFMVSKLDKQQVQLMLTLKGSVMSLKNALNAQSHLLDNGINSDAFNYQWTP